jgi:hypothetical protein
VQAQTMVAYYFTLLRFSFMHAQRSASNSARQVMIKLGIVDRTKFCPVIFSLVQLLFKVTVKFPLCLLKHYAMKTYGGAEV